MFERYGSELRFTKKAVQEVAREGLDRGGGARGLRGVLEEVLVDAMFEVPGSVSIYPLASRTRSRGSSRVTSGARVRGSGELMNSP